MKKLLLLLFLATSNMTTQISVLDAAKAAKKSTPGVPQCIGCGNFDTFDGKPGGYCSRGCKDYYMTHPTNPINTATPGTIKFYTKDKDYYSFTNFYKGTPGSGKDTKLASQVPVTVDIPGMGTFNTSEEAFQCFKFFGNKHLIQQVRKAFMKPSIREAYEEIKPLNTQAHPEWYKMRLYVLYAIVKAKFKQHPQLQQLLCSTGTQELIEDTASDSSRHDPYWGNNTSQGGPGNPKAGLPGFNHLGKILMKVRNELCGSNYPAQLQPETTGTMAEFEHELGNHLETWVNTFGQPIGFQQQQMQSQGLPFPSASAAATAAASGGDYQHNATASDEEDSGMINIQCRTCGKKLKINPGEAPFCSSKCQERHESPNRKMRRGRSPSPSK